MIYKGIGNKNICKRVYSRIEIINDDTKTNNNVMVHM